ncbi:MAG: exopolysaccharide biosynthesis protein [Bacillota bacterium]|nr:exopolysaccharide biosynthesis protein [Bacillota bacterium]
MATAVIIITTTLRMERKKGERKKMIDVHCHILPKIDDGSKNIEMTANMLKIAQNDGLDKIIVTPHYVTGMFENSYENIVSALDNINNLISENGLNIKLVPGQEVFLDKHTLDLYKDGVIRGINGGSYLLCELPMDKLPEDALDIIYELHILGSRVIIAHPERYMYFMEDLTLINDFIKEGCYFQINSGSITGIFGHEIKKTAKLMIKNGICDFIGSDAHNADTRSPKIKYAIDKAEDNLKGIKDTLIKNPYFLLANEEINVKCRKPYKKSRLFFNK